MYRILRVGSQARKITSLENLQTAPVITPEDSIAVLCGDVQVNKVLKVKPYAYPPWVARPDLVICKDEEHALKINVIHQGRSTYR